MVRSRGRAGGSAVVGRVLPHAPNLLFRGFSVKVVRHTNWADVCGKRDGGLAAADGLPPFLVAARTDPNKDVVVKKVTIEAV